MSNGSSSNTGVIVVALIGAVGSIGAALIGLMPWLTSKPDTKPEAKHDAKTAIVKSNEDKKAKPQKPPIDVAYRAAKIPTRGLVAVLSNRSDKDPLEGVIVTVTTPGSPSERIYRLEAALKPNQSVDVGWLELSNTKLKKGDIVKIRATGFPLEHVETILAE